MSSPSSQQGPSLSERIDALITHVEAAEQAAEAEKLPDLRALDGAVEALCADIAAAQPQDAKAAQDAMGTLIARLDALAARIKEIQDSTGGDNG